MSRTHFAVAVVGVVLFLSLRAEAQAPPFFNGAAGIFDPEISVVQSGVILDAQAVVSADRKYVTMTTRFQSAQLLNLREFTFQSGAPVRGGLQQGAGGVAGAGAVGNVAARGANPENGSGSPAGLARSGAASSHAVPGKAYPTPGNATRANAYSGSVLDKEGMTLVGRVRPAPLDP
jgi:hypothetical protein